jgi:lauroyl/myristoyl acyltransferase
MISKIPLKMNLVIAGWIGERIARLFKGSDTASRKMKVLLPSDPPAGYSYRKLMPLVFCDRIKFPCFTNPANHLHTLFDVRGREQLDRVLETSGAIMQFSHFGAYEPAFLYLARMGYPVHVVRVISHPAGNRFDKPGLQRSLAVQRFGIIKKTHIDFIYYKPGRAYFPMLSDLLARKEIVVTFLDAGAPHFMDVPFFDGKLRVASNSAFLAWKCQVPVIPVFSVRKGWYRYEIHIERPVYPVSGMQETLQLASTRFADLLQQYVSRYPGQWFLLHHLEFSPDDSSRWRLSMPEKKDEIYYEPADFGL